MISARRRHPNTPQEEKKKKGALLIRPLVLKLPIDFHCGRLWASDLLRFLASTKAKLSHLEARSAFRDSSSTRTPPANLFPSGVIFFFFLLFTGPTGFQHKRSDRRSFCHIIPVYLSSFSFLPSLLSLGLALQLYDSEAPNSDDCGILARGQ